VSDLGNRGADVERDRWDRAKSLVSYPGAPCSISPQLQMPLNGFYCSGTTDTLSMLYTPRDFFMRRGGEGERRRIHKLIFLNFREDDFKVDWLARIAFFIIFCISSCRERVQRHHFYKFKWTILASVPDPMDL
jgi:hypothetical protein